MLARNVTNISFESFRELSKDKKVILLYPWANFRNIFLSYFLDELQEGLLYHRIPENMESLAEWVKGLLDEIQHVVPDFGGQLASALENGNASAMGKALAQDLAQIKSDRVVLFIDELDRVPQDADLREFISALVDNLSDTSQLAVNSRLLTYDPWINWVNSDEAVVLGTAHRRNNLMFTKEEIPKPQLEVYAFGRGHVITNGREIRNWDGALPRNLFFYFVDNPLVTRNQIFQVFWPRLSVKDATNVYHVTKRKITERISMNVDDDENYELTSYSAGFYMPSNKVVRHYDVFDFEEAIEQALVSEDPHEQEVLFSHAIDIYKGPFLQTVTLPWVEERRAQLQEVYAEALIGMARLQVAQEAWEEALGFYARALKEAPQREDVHRDAMQMYVNLGRPDDAKAQYKALESHLKKTVGVPPSNESQELLKSIV
jgi:two-component SAPR family response regulator